MFAYTGLTPQQMEKLATEVRSVFYSQFAFFCFQTMTDHTLSELGLRYQRWQNISGGHYVGQRQAPCGVHPPNHFLNAKAGIIFFRIRSASLHSLALHLGPLHAGGGGLN